MSRKPPKTSNSLSSRNFQLVELIRTEKIFLSLILVGFIVSALFYQQRNIAMWIGFAFAGYAAVANDSIQTIGTFIGSNQKTKWWILWLFIGGLFLLTVTYSFFEFDGDVTYQRLSDGKGGSKYPHPESFSYLQVVAPLFLLIITRLRMPVSTTFLLLSSFSATSSGITSVLAKSLSGYAMAFIVSGVIWAISYNYIRKWFKHRKSHRAWTIIQWITSGTLWSVWIMQDAANIAVYLPRQLDGVQFLGFAAVIFLGLGVIFYLKGDKIQGIVTEKTRLEDVRAATFVDFIYALLLIYKLFISTVPLSTTWVFLGVLGGREIAINILRKKSGKKHVKQSFKIVGRDMLYALIGLAVSIIIALAVNPTIHDALLGKH
ncbi:hypothetical protein [Luteibaculum oceani]|uniref:Phosphate/sulfate permease n=1 Tax=Luteibaculum oceani TaxID=1294296 RepID=A0A5C6UZS4_9FLAO|nr:hypothetical protein [Luteibaculum oceani]TXC78892.1 hypothetical protein FRX97_06675 [Luteibaculum oceani]